MFYFLSQFRNDFFPVNIFRYITFRAGLAAVTTFLIMIVVGPWFIRKLAQWNMGEKPVLGGGREAVLGAELKLKCGTPTMGGILIIGSILVSVLLWADMTNPYILLDPPDDGLDGAGWLRGRLHENHRDQQERDAGADKNDLAGGPGDHRQFLCLCPP